MRATQVLALPDSCTRSRPVLTADGTGGQTAGTPATATYACRLAATGGHEVVIAAQLTAERTVTVTLPYDADVQAQDTLAIGTRVLSVIAVLVSGAWETARRVLAVEVQ
jgi:SPP1 family predicted phage head-tail adaptor